MSIFRDFFVKEKPVFTGITRGVGGFGFGASAAGGGAGGVSTGPFTISGGTVLTPGNGNKYHVFTTSGSLVISPGPGCDGTIDTFILAGGGSGGRSGPSYAGSAAGGAGGAVTMSSFQIYGNAESPVTYPVTLGTGAPENTTNSTPGTQGNHSSIDFSPFSDGPSAAQILIQAMGGGYGSTAATPVAGGPGGCGGGGNSSNTGGDLQAPPNSPDYSNCPGTVTVYGNAGHSDTSIYGSGGGGSGLGGVGEGPSADGTNHGGDGGNGRAFPSYPGPLIGPALPSPEQPAFTSAVGPTGLYGGGGGGANYRMNHGSHGTGGSGGGAGAAGNGVKYTGGGGGGGYGQPNGAPGGSGGDGIVIVKYSIS